MGGTSFDVSSSRQPARDRHLSEIDRLPVRLPMIEIRTIGAAAARSHAQRDQTMTVGPEAPARARALSLRPRGTDQR